MSESQPIAWLWQASKILDDGCCLFYPTAERADAEISRFGGWKTPVFDVGPPSTDPISEEELWKVLRGHRLQPALWLPPEGAAAVSAFLKAEKARS